MTLGGIRIAFDGFHAVCPCTIVGFLGEGEKRIGISSRRSDTLETNLLAGEFLERNLAITIGIEFSDIASHHDALGIIIGSNAIGFAIIFSRHIHGNELEVTGFLAGLILSSGDIFMDNLEARAGSSEDHVDLALVGNLGLGIGAGSDEGSVDGTGSQGKTIGSEGGSDGDGEGIARGILLKNRFQGSGVGTEIDSLTARGELDTDVLGGTGVGGATGKSRGAEKKSGTELRNFFHKDFNPF